MSYPTKSAALAAGRHAKSLLNKPAGWAVTLYGAPSAWSYNLSNGPMRLCQTCGDTDAGPRFFALLSDRMENPIGGSMLWHHVFIHANPNRVIERQIKLARKVIAEINRVDTHIAAL